ncbi:unnamed protein product [Rangifer tarandus platyrhynchus]|uniref:G-protein coupled receptors family 1 profile domain-containing protein n=1 Tax=Rangifer tarandus platyrhynchus TaxID=3082113 RepID=A0ABN8ZWU9_RANTA|nr:unnamed protein product [Rangifer tarandus platyrhynchus]
MGNHTRLTVFILAGLTDDPQMKIVLFIFLLLTYFITGNLTIITLTLWDGHLQTPMYFFLRNFSLLDYCKSNVIDHFSCGYFPLLYLSCSDTKFLEIVGFSCAVVILLFTLALIILSYTYIIRIILTILSTTQRTKAFSTCSSHMIVISISYGSCIFMYMNPSAKDRVSLTKGVAVLNASIPPMLNPFIYTLRIQQVKQAFMEMERRTVFFSSK